MTRLVRNSRKARIGACFVGVLAVLGASLVGLPRRAVAGPSLNIIQITTYSSSSNDYVDSDRKLGLGFGALFGFSLNDNLILEPGIVYLNRNFDEIYRGIRGSINSKAIQIPVALKWKFLPFLSAGLGVYYSHTLGQLGLSVNGAELKQDYIGEVTTEVPWRYNSSEWGWLATVAGNMALTEKVDLIGDLRYQRHVRWEAFYTSSDLQLFVGLGIKEIF